MSFHHAGPIVFNDDINDWLELIVFPTALMLQKCQSTGLLYSKDTNRRKCWPVCGTFFLQSLDVHAVRQSIVDNVCVIFRAKSASISRYDADTGCLQLLNVSGGIIESWWQAQVDSRTG